MDITLEEYKKELAKLLDKPIDDPLNVIEKFYKSKIRVSVFAAIIKKQYSTSKPHYGLY